MEYVHYCQVSETFSRPVSMKMQTALKKEASVDVAAI